MAAQKDIDYIARIIEDGTIGSLKAGQLASLNALLTHDNILRPDARLSALAETVRLHMIRAMIEAFEERSKVMQNWMLFFAAIAVVATLMPYVIAPSPFFGASQSSTATPATTVQGLAPIQPSRASDPSQGQRPSSGQATASQAVSAPMPASK